MTAKAVRWCALAAVALAWLARGALAQDFRVDTRLFARHGTSGATDRSKPVGRNTALFHAGKVYDSVYSGHEMTIFEPAHQQFVLLDSDRKLSTVVKFTDIEQVLYHAEQKARPKLEDLRKHADVRDTPLIEHLQFQLEPRFTTDFDPKSRRLTLRNSVMSYEIRCESHPVPEVVTAYLFYADWAARLNFVVEAKSPLPSARLQVNEALRQRTLLPREVVREVHKTSQRLMAEHKFYWKLEHEDRKTIRYWEERLLRGELKRVPFDEYSAPSRKETQSASR